MSLWKLRLSEEDTHFSKSIGSEMLCVSLGHLRKTTNVWVFSSRRSERPSLPLCFKEPTHETTAVPGSRNNQVVRDFDKHVLASIAPHIRIWPGDCTPHPGRRAGYLDKAQRRQPWGTQQVGGRMEDREAVVVPRAACRPCGGLRRAPPGRGKLAEKTRVEQNSSERIRRLQPSSYNPAKQLPVFRRFQEGALELWVQF